MKVLEITPLKGKALTVLMVEKEYNEPFWLIDPPADLASQTLSSLFRPSIAFTKFLEKLVQKVNPDFATEELGVRDSTAFFEKNTLAQLFQERKIPFHPVDIDENAKGYLAANMGEKKQIVNQVLGELSKLSKKGDDDEKTSIDEEYLVAYGQCVQQELEELKHEAGFSIRESWIAMGILERAKELDGKDELRCLHISSPEHVNGVKKILESVDVPVETLKLSKEVVSTHPDAPHPEEMQNLLQSMQIQVKPTIKRSSDDAPYLLFFLDTDRIASPFDVCMAYDAGFNAVIPYENVTPEDAKKIVQDAIFSRGPKAVKHTCFFIGGKDAEKAEEISKVASSTMFPPFQASVIVDPGGAYTTAAAAVAKVEDALASHKLGSLGEKSCAVFGTGSVGKIIAVLLTRLGCNVTIVSLNPNRKDGDEYAEKLGMILNERYGANVQGVFAPTVEKKIEVIKKADVIFCAGTRGVRIIEKSFFKKIKLMKIMADLNAIPPLGIEGIKLKDNMREMAPGIFGIGALAIGDLKHRLEKAILKEVRSNGTGTYNYSFALQLARKILRKEIYPSKLTLTLSYQDANKQ